MLQSVSGMTTGLQIKGRQQIQGRIGPDKKLLGEPSLRFSAQTLSEDDIRHITEQAQTLFPNTKDVDPKRFLLNTHPHLATATNMKDRWNSFRFLLGVAATSYFQSLFMRKDAKPITWLMLTRLDSKEQLDNWMEIHSDDTETRGLGRGTSLSMKTRRISDHEALSRGQLKRV